MKPLQTTMQNAISTLRNVPVLFIAIWIGLFLILFAILFQFELVPDAILGNDDTDTEELAVYDEVPTVLAAGEEQDLSEEGVHNPVRIIIDAIGVDVNVENPMSRDIAVLDSALTNGAVHYPGSGDLEDISNLFVFGHSSYLPNVINQSYTAFNGLGELKDGDIIRVRSTQKEYIYKVEHVELVDANDAWVDLNTAEKKLTLSTCNTFGRKQDRFVVEAQFVGSYALENGEENDLTL